MNRVAENPRRSTGERAARDPGSRVVAASAAVTATGAATCAIGCVLPFALPAFAMAGAGGIVAWLIQAHGWMTDLAFVVVTGAWFWIGWRSVRHKAVPTTWTLSAMAGATLLLGLALIWPTIEPIVLELPVS